MNYYAELAEKKNDTVKRGNLSYGKYEIKKEKESFSTKGFAYVGYVYSDDGSITKTAPRESIEECESDIMQHKTFKAYNSKEKQNYGYTSIKLIKEETYKGCLIEVFKCQTPLEKGEGIARYQYHASDKKMNIWVDGSCNSESECLREAKQKIDMKVRNNSKEEKSNSVVTRGTIHGHKYEVERVDYLGQATYIGYVYDKEGNTIFKTNIYMKAGACEQEIKSKVFNSKENSMNYYEKIIQEKENASEEYIRKMYAEIQELKRKGVKDIDKYYAAINQYKEAEEQMKRYKETGKSYYKTAADNLKREADQWMREIKASMHNEKEEKDNDSVEDKFTHKGCLITIVKKSSGRYAFSITQNRHEEMSDQTYSTQDEAERGAKKEVDEVWSCKDNSKSYYQSIIEKKNEEPVKRAEQLAREGKQYAEIIETLKKEYNLSADKAARAADQGKRNYELNPINGEHKKPARI